MVNIVETLHISGGYLLKCTHPATSLGGLAARFQIFLPQCIGSITEPHKRVPAVYYLAGLSCNEETGPTKLNGFEKANAVKVALVFPDTSPRGANVTGENDYWDLGLGAGFYVNATKEPWSKHYRMYDYVLNELPSLVESNFPIDPTSRSIMGHSMGGHGALVIGMKNPSRYTSISAFAPICHPTRCPWGTKAFDHYFTDPKEGNHYDAVELLKGLIAQQKTDQLPSVLIDQGTGDKFLHDPDQLRTNDLAELCLTTRPSLPVTLRLQNGYDHSYSFIADFVADHLEFHAKQLYRTETN